MSNTTATRLCPECQSELLFPTPSFCPTCHIQLKNPKSTIFNLPEYLSIQYPKIIEKGKLRLQEELKDEMKKPDANSEKIQTEISDKISTEITVEYQRLLLKLKASDKIACAMDTFRMLQVSNNSNMTPENRRKFVGICKGIGKLAKTIDDYIIAGGQCYGGLTTTELGDDLRDSEPTER